MSLKLKSSDGEIFDVDANIMRVSELLRDFGRSSENEEPIPLDDIKADTLKRVIMWAEHHADDSFEGESDAYGKKLDLTEPWDAEFFNIENEKIFDLILAANFLDIKGLLDFGCKKIASMIRGKTSEEIRETFSIKDDFTPEEREKVQKENEWVDEQK